MKINVGIPKMNLDVILLKNKEKFSSDIIKNSYSKNLCWFWKYEPWFLLYFQYYLLEDILFIMPCIKLP